MEREADNKGKKLEKVLVNNLVFKSKITTKVIDFKGKYIQSTGK
jgi:hypothetical protein